MGREPGVSGLTAPPETPDGGGRAACGFDLAPSVTVSRSRRQGYGGRPARARGTAGVSHVRICEPLKGWTQPPLVTDRHGFDYGLGVPPELLTTGSESECARTSAAWRDAPANPAARPSS
jgi:hypothetical protein